ncbi:MAG: ROK family protein, partial [Oscillospiraceae bacterium]|nr:ROK family protein [Oscillospiraceae bacterium]
GMSIKAGVVNENGDILAKYAVPTPKNDNEAFLSAMLEGINKAIEEAGIQKTEIKAIGIGNPGVVDRDRGILLEATNIGFSDISAREFLQKEFGDIPVLVENDANCAALGEFYKAESTKNFIFITLGTGVGGGIIINGRLYLGTNGAAGELGHIVTHTNGRQCGCGRKGCWETYASVTGLIETTKEHRDEIKTLSPDEEISGRTVFELARKGDKDAERIRDMWIEEIAIGVVDMVNIFQPDQIIIGGAISKEGDTILLPIIDYVNKNAFCSERLTKPKIEISKIGGDAGIIGAALIYKNSL